MSVHIHGQYNRAPFDGWTADYAQPGKCKDYYYPNAQNAQTIWYHDHTEYGTGENVYMDLYAFYLLSDYEEQTLGLPDGDHDVPLVLTAKQFAEDGSLVYDTNNDTGLWGDIIEVNGQPWPYFRVEPRKYRLRVLNGAVSCSFVIYLQEDGTNKTMNFDIIGPDGGLFNHPVQTSNFAIAGGERYEIVVDFSNHKGRNFTMSNERGMAGNLDYAIRRPRSEVTKKWGYDNATMFIDPMEPQFRPKNIDAADYTQSAIRNKLDWFYETNAYNQTAA